MSSLFLIALPVLIEGDFPYLSEGGGWRRWQVNPDSESVVFIPDPFLVDGTLRLMVGEDTLTPSYERCSSDSSPGFKVTLPSEMLSPHSPPVLFWRSLGWDNSLLRWQFYALRQERDTLSPDRPPQSHPLPPSERTPLGLRKSGYITRGLRLGSTGEQELTSGIHLEIGGEVSPGIAVEGVLDDRALGTSSLSSLPLEELDRAYLRVTTPTTRTVIGDYDLQWGIGWWEPVKRRLKGLIGEWRTSRLSLQGAVASGRNRRRTQFITPRPQDQGPYYLTDFDGKKISLVVGSEQVWVNGKILNRGVQGEYIIDYPSGSITFTPSFPITGEERIEVEFEFSDDSYSRLLYGIYASGMGERGLSWQMAAIEEGAQKENPLQWEWREEWRQVVAQAGDNPSQSQIFAIDSVGTGNGDYVWGDTLRSHLRFSPPDSSGKPTGYLQAFFSPQRGGGYRRIYHPSWNLYYFQYVGEGEGEWAPVRFIPLPDRHRWGWSQLDWKENRSFLSLTLGLSDRDLNILSPYNDNDNRGLGIRLKGGRSLWEEKVMVETRGEWSSPNFVPPYREREKEGARKWAMDTLTAEGVRQLENRIELRPSDRVNFSLEGGYREQSSKSLSRRWGVGVRGEGLREWWVLNYENVVSQQRSPSLFNNVHRFQGSIKRQWGKVFGEAIGVWEENSYKGGPLAYAKIIRGTIALGSEDKGEFRKWGIIGKTEDLIPFWRRAFTWGYLGQWSSQRDWAHWDVRLFQTLRQGGDTLGVKRAVGLKINGNWTLRRSWAFLEGNYWLRSGSEPDMVWIAQYVGERSGSWRREGDRWVPDPQGSFNLNLFPSDLSLPTTSLLSQWEMRIEPSSPLIIPGLPGTLQFRRSLLRWEWEGRGTMTNPWKMAVPGERFSPLTDLLSAQELWRNDLYLTSSNRSSEVRTTLESERRRGSRLAGGGRERRYLLRGRILKVFSYGLSSHLTLFHQRFRREEPLVNRPTEIVFSNGAEIQPAWKINSLTWALASGYEQRREKINGGEVREKRLAPSAQWNTKGGFLSAEVTWRRLDTRGSAFSYALLQGWKPGNNFALVLRSQINLRKGAYLNGEIISRWMGKDPPLWNSRVEATIPL